jgi:hypothetical protein
MTGWWSNVVMATYAVPPAVLRPFLPPPPAGPELELDTRPDLCGQLPPGAGIISLVALQASRVRVLGVRWPGFTRFSAMYLRCYVRQGPSRGVVYIRELTNSPVIAWGGKRAFNQPMRVVPSPGLQAEVRHQTLMLGVEYHLPWPVTDPDASGRVPRGTPTQEFYARLVGAKPPARPGPRSPEVWLTDRPYVFGCHGPQRGHAPFVYEVIHPAWGVHPAVQCDIHIDFARVFSPDLGFLSGLEPVHAMIAVGSEVAIFPKRAGVGVRWGVRRKEPRPGAGATPGA